MSKSTDDLVAAALAIRDRAYAPYSNHPVGAAVLDEAGSVHVGTNVENAAYPQGVCAEASAISAMIAAGGRAIKSIAIAGPGQALCTPCGGCRQKIREFAATDTPVIVVRSDGSFQTFALDTLLPDSFGPDNLGPQA